LDAKAFKAALEKFLNLLSDEAKDNFIDGVIAQVLVIY
jgi:hypothetical protein